LIVAGSTVTLELVCASKNHPEQVKEVYAAGEEFSRRLKQKLQQATDAAGTKVEVIEIAVVRQSIKLKQVVGDIWKDAYRQVLPSK
jgi:hypothetical protein